LGCTSSRRATPTTLAPDAGVSSTMRSFSAAGQRPRRSGPVRDAYRRAASYVDKILRGAKPGDLPVQLPTKVELVVNLKAARAIGFPLLDPFLLRADEIIECGRPMAALGTTLPSTCHLSIRGRVRLIHPARPSSALGVAGANTFRPRVCAHAAGSLQEDSTVWAGGTAF
jgi:ABC transporter substrate binding protein